MNIPSLNKNSTTKEGREKILKAISQSCGGQKKRDITCWNMYNNEHDESDYDYLRKVGDYEYPAHVRHIPKQRSKIDLLTSQQARRPFTFSVTADDADTKGKKYHEITKGYLKAYTDALKIKLYDNKLKLSQMELQFKTMQNQLAQEAQNEEQQQQQQQLQMLMPSLTTKMELIKDAMAEEDILTEKDVERLKYKYRYEYKDYAEELAQVTAKKLRQVQRIKQKSKKNFISKCVTGKEYYYVDYLPGKKLPDFESLNSMKVFYPNEENIQFTHQSSWVAIEESMSSAQVIAEYGHKMTKEEVAKIEKYDGTYNWSNGNFIATPGNGAVLNTSNNTYNSSDTIGSGIRVYKIWWRAQKQIKAVQKPNKHNGKYFTHFIENKPVIDVDDYAYERRSKKYIKNSDDRIKYNAEDIEAISTSNGEKFERRYVDIRYKGVIIDGTIIFSEVDPVQPRLADDFSFVPLPVFGRTFNDITEQPYSLIWATRELQNSYNIVHYHRELMLALSGAKGLVMDISQKPEGMSDQEWYYQMKMGKYLIQRTKKTGNVDRSFNQFPRVDTSISDSVQYLEMMLEQIDNSIGDIMGVSKPRQGQVVSTDQVGTSEMSIKQSNLITEILYDDHDEIERQALEMDLQLACKYCLGKGALLDMSDFTSGTEFVKIPPGILDKMTPVIHIANNTKEEASVNDLKGLALAQQKAGAMPFSDFLNIYNTDTLKELEKKVQYFAEKSEEIAAQRAGALEDNKAKLEQESIKLKGEIDAQIKQSANEIEIYKTKLEESKIQIDSQLKQRELDIEEGKNKQDGNLKLLELINEDKSETSLLDENKRSSMVQEKLSALQIQLDAIMNTEQLRQSEDDKNKKNAIESKKVTVDKKKLNREHIKDT